MPPDIKNFGLIKGANEGKLDKAEMVFNYLTGTQFKKRFESILEAYLEMQSDLDSERRLLEKSWAKREKQIDRFIRNVPVCMATCRVWVQRCPMLNY